MEDKVSRQTVGQVAVVSFAQATVDPEFIKSFCQVMDEIEADGEIRAVVVTGARGKIFFAGYNIGLLVAEADPAAVVARTLEVQAMMDRIEQCPKPVIGAVNGLALGGGCEMVLAFDIVYASELAAFGVPEVKVGLVPAAGGTIRLPRQVGRHKAMEMALTGRMYSAAEAKEMGLVNEVVHHDDLIEHAVKTAEAIAANAPVAVRVAKENINRSAGLLDKQLELLLAQGCAECLQTEDIKEGVAAFFEKRKPSFKGR